MPTAPLGTVTLDYATHGDPGGIPVLMIMGLGSQRITWPRELIERLVDHRLHVVTFDNRDAGASTVLDGAGPVTDGELLAALTGEPVEPAYGLGDMAADAAGLLDHLGLGAVHVVGASMGAMIAQRLALAHPERVLTLTSIMSTTGAPEVGNPSDVAAGVLTAAPPDERDAAIDHRVETARVISGPLFDEQRARERAARSWDRGQHPHGTARQLLAILADGDRTDQLGSLEVPTLVIHGADDPLIDPSGGRATAAAIPGARLRIVEDMGHDLPLPLVDDLAREIAAHAGAAP